MKIERTDYRKPWKWKVIFQRALELQTRVDGLQEQAHNHLTKADQLVLEKEALQVENDAIKTQQLLLIVENEALKSQQQKLKTDMAALLRWIYVTHHLEGPFLEGAVRNILNKKR